MIKHLKGVYLPSSDASNFGLSDDLEIGADSVGASSKLIQNIYNIKR